MLVWAAKTEVGEKVLHLGGCSLETPGTPQMWLGWSHHTISHQDWDRKANHFPQS